MLPLAATLWVKSQIIGQMIEEQYKVPKPFLTDDTKERIERGLNESWQNAKEILVSYYRN